MRHGSAAGSAGGTQFSRELIEFHQNKTVSVRLDKSLPQVRTRSKHLISIFSQLGNDFAASLLRGFASPQCNHFEVTMLDLFYVAAAIAFFVLLWGFTKASERL